MADFGLNDRNDEFSLLQGGFKRDFTVMQSR